MSRQINDQAFDLIKRDEGLRLTAYYDLAGVLTVGYGHTGPDVFEGMMIDESDAEEMLEKDLRKFEEAVGQAVVGSATSDNQFSAMVSLAYNIGVRAFLASTVLRRHRAGRFAEAADAFLLWNKAHVDGELVEVEGLTRRRQEERAIYLGE